MKHLAAMNVIAESGTDAYTATPLSKALTEPRFRDGITYTSALPASPPWLESIDI